MTFDIAVLGAGVCGRLMAWQLAQRGYRVQLFEAQSARCQRSASFVAAAMLSPFAEAAVSEPYIGRLGWASMALWPSLLSALPAPVFFQQEGTLVIWHPTDRAEKTRFLQKLNQNTALPLNDVDAHHPSVYREIDHAQIAQLEPQLANRQCFSQAVYLPHEGQLDNQALLPLLIEAFRDLGGVCFWESPLSLETARHDLKAALIVDCRGLGAKNEWPMLVAGKTQCVQALRGVRGELMRVSAPDIKLHRPVRLLHPRYPLYVVPKRDDMYVVGATVIESEDMSPVSVHAAMELLSALYTVHPAFAEARIVHMQSQCRPTLADHRPAIRYEAGSTKQCGALYINGLSRHGFLMAPIVVKSAIQAIEAILKEGANDTDYLTHWKQRQAFPELFG